MTGIPLILAFLIAIVLMIIAISKYKIHPFLAIMVISVVFGLVGGIPLAKVDKTPGIADVVSAGFAVVLPTLNSEERKLRAVINP